MDTYKYRLSTKEGVIEQGIVKALSRQDAAMQVRRPDAFVLSIKSGKRRGVLARIDSAAFRLSAMERIIFTDHLASMIESGTPMVDALETFKEDESKHVESIISDIVGSLQQGRKLSEAMAQFPKHFSQFYLSLVEAGELTGRLDETLWYLGAELRREHEFRERIRSAMIYPALVITMALAVVTLMVTIVLPKLSELIRSFGPDIPLASRIIFAVSDSLVRFAPLIAALGIATVIGSIAALKTKKARVKIDSYILNLPLIGQLQKKYILARVMRILGSSMKYGIPLPEALSNVTSVAGNIRYREAFARINRKITRGMGFSAAMAAEGTAMFPSTVIRSLKGAEKTGSLDAAMLRLSSFYEAEVDRLLKRITDLIEPVLVIFLGVIVGAIALGVVMPIYQMTGRIK